MRSEYCWRPIRCLPRLRVFAGRNQAEDSLDSSRTRDAFQILISENNRASGDIVGFGHRYSDAALLVAGVMPGNAPGQSQQIRCKLPNDSVRQSKFSRLHDCPISIELELNSDPLARVAAL